MRDARFQGRLGQIAEGEPDNDESPVTDDVLHRLQVNPLYMTIGK